MARGLRNNNPGNIVKDGKRWQGEIVPSRDSRFKQFESIEWGYRAMFVNLASYIRKGHNTIAKMINRWAPPFENNTASYIRHVSTRTGVPADKVISASNAYVLIEIVKAISLIENGKIANEQDVLKGFRLWQGGVAKKKVTKYSITVIIACLMLIAGGFILTRK